MKSWFAAAALCAVAIFCQAAGDAAARPLDKLFTSYPDILGTVFDVPVTKAEMFEYYRDGKGLPEWLPEPYLDEQRAAFARAFVEQREREIGARLKGFLPSGERARKYLEKQLEGLSEDELASMLRDEKMTRPEYLDKLSADPAIQKQAAEADFMDSLAARHVVTDEDLDKYFQAHIDEYRYSDQEYANFELLNPDGTIIEDTSNCDKKCKTMHLRRELDSSLVLALDKLKDNELSAPIELNGHTVIVHKLPLPDPVLGGRRFQLRLQLEKERAGDARGTLHEMSKFKLNFEVPEVPEPSF